MSIVQDFPILEEYEFNVPNIHTSCYCSCKSLKESVNDDKCNYGEFAESGDGSNNLKLLLKSLKPKSMIAFSIITSKAFKFLSEGALSGGSLLIICIISSVISMISRFTASFVYLCLRFNAVRRWGIVWSIVGIVDCILKWDK